MKEIKIRVVIGDQVEENGNVNKDAKILTAVKYNGIEGDMEKIKWLMFVLENLKQEQLKKFQKKRFDIEWQ